MLRILNIEGIKLNSADTGEILYSKNPTLVFTIEAPMYWWIDCEFSHFSFILPKNNLRYCFDSWDTDNPYIQRMQLALQNITDERQLMQVMPLGTIFSAKVELSYHQILELCENYVTGEYDYRGFYNQWPTEREWTDLCESLLDIRGIRDFVKGDY